MFTLRCTRKLLKRLGARPSSEAITPTTVLGDWYANLLYRRPQQLVLAMSERSLLCVLVPAAPGRRLGQRLRDAAGELLLEIGVPLPLVAAELQSMEPMSIGATTSRSVLGCMNDAVVQLDAYAAGHAGRVTLRDATLHLAENIYSLTDHQTPRLKALELFGVATDVRRLREGSWLH